MLLRRGLKTSSVRPSQPLFTPYVAPLNEKQKKSIRRVALLDAPNFHLGRHKDASWIISASKRSQEQRQAMANTHKRLKEIVKKELELGGGKRWEVVLVGVDAWINGGVHDAPFEFALVDTHHPAGLPPGSPDAQLPAYDPAALAGILAAHGHTGAFLLPPWDMGPLPKSIVASTYVPPPARDLAVPWSHEPLAPLDQTIQYPPRPPLRDLLYPPTLLAHHPESDAAPTSESDDSPLPGHAGTQFSLTLPSPSSASTPTPLTTKLISTYFALDPRASAVFVLVYTWLRSHGITELGTTALGLMIVRFLQDLGKVPGLMSTSSGPGSSPQGKGEKVAEEEKGSGGGNELLQRRREKKTLGASRTAQRVWVPLHEADGTVTTAELEYEVADLEGLLAMATKNRKDAARKAVEEDAVVDLASGNQRRVVEVKHKSASLVWDFFGLWRSAPTIARYAHSVAANAYIPRAIPAIRRRQESVADIFMMLANQRRARGGAVGVPPSKRGQASVLPALKPAAAADVPPPQEGAGWGPTEQPLAWALHALVVPDPFVPAHNHAAAFSRASLHSIARQAATAHRLLAHKYPLLSIFGPEFKEHLYGAKSAKIRERMEMLEAEERGDGGGGSGSGGWRSGAEVGSGAASGEFGGGEGFHARRPFSTSAVAATMAVGMQAPRPVFRVTQVHLGLGLGRRGVNSSAVAPAPGASTPAPQPDASSPDFPSHSVVWDAQTELRATNTNSESPRPARLSFAEMQAGNLSYAEVRARAKQESAAAASLSLKQARAEHSVAAAAAFAEKEAAAAALAKKQAEQWAVQAALRSTEAKAAHYAAIEARRTTLARVQRAVSIKYSKWVEGEEKRMHYKVEPFGSTAYGVCSPSSDLDLVIIDPSMPDGCAPGAKPHNQRIYNVHNLAGVLRKAGFVDVVPIKATVAIVKFRDPATNISCDININERLGLRNTRLLALYMRTSPLLRPLAAFIKRWARPRGLNSPAGAPGNGGVTFSSYALVLMTLAFLQSRGLAPNLQENIDADKRSFFWVKEKRRGAAEAVRCETSFQTFETVKGWAPPPELALEFREVVGQWFRYWAEEHDYRRTAVNIRQGGFVSKIAEDDDSGVGRKQFSEGDSTPLEGTAPGPGQHAVDNHSPSSTQADIPGWLDVPVCVMDPFIRTKIVTRGVDASWQMAFQLECLAGAESIEAGSSLYDLLNPVEQEYTPTPPRLSPHLIKKKKKVAKIADYINVLVEAAPKEQNLPIYRANAKRPSIDVVLEDTQARCVPREVVEDEPEGFGLRKNCSREEEVVN